MEMYNCYDISYKFQLKQYFKTKKESIWYNLMFYDSQKNLENMHTIQWGESSLNDSMNQMNGLKTCHCTKKYRSNQSQALSAHSSVES